MFKVNDESFRFFSDAVRRAETLGAEVFEEATGLRRWSPIPPRATTRRRTKHVLVQADGTLTPFSKVKQR
jgi:hypothetical protein